MLFLPRILCTVTLLSLISLVWASCPEGRQEHDRSGECVSIRDWKGIIVKEPLASGSGWQFERSLPIGAKAHGYQVVSAPDHPVRYGKNSERFEVRPGDCSRSDYGWNDCRNDRERSELVQRGYRQRQGDEYWYRWSIYLPKFHRNLHPTSLCYGQFHQVGNCEPVFMFREYEGGYWLHIDNQLIGYGEQNLNLLNPGEFVGRWNDIVVNAGWTTKKKGWMKVWVNGIQKVYYTGKTMSCGNEVYFKYGVYRTYISRRKLTNAVTTIAYYDGVVRSRSKTGMFDSLAE